MKKYLVCMIVLVFMFSCSGCYDGYSIANKYPNYKADCWYCEEIDFTFFYEYYKDGRMKHTTYSLNKDGETLIVWIDFVFDDWCMELDRGLGETSQEDELMSGTWYYRNGNLVLTVNTDKLFDGIYEELVFIPGK